MITFFAVVACYAIDGAKGLSLFIQGKALNTKSVGISLFGPIVLLTALTAICKAISLSKLGGSLKIIWYTRRKTIWERFTFLID